MRKRIVSIVSSSHSGSTLLELMLCAHSNCIGIGEAFQLVDPRNNRINMLEGEVCSCGAAIDTCIFWSRIIKELKSRNELKPEEKYRLITKQSDEIFGSEYLLVDSSKVLRSLALLTNIPEIKLFVIHLIKDVRAYTVSMQDNYRRNAHHYSLANLIKARGWKGIIRFLQRSRIYSFHDWYWTQKKLDNFVRREKIPTFRLGYESLCFETESSVRDLCAFLDLEFDESMLTPAGVNCHNIFGNRMRFQSEKLRRIAYDNRWLYKTDWVVPSLIFPYIMKYNYRAVYAENGKRVWTR